LEKGGNSGLVLILAFLVAMYVFVFGESGVLERYELRKSKARLAGRIEALKKQNGDLGALTDAGGRETLLREEALRTGYLHPGEKIVVFRDEERDDRRKQKAKGDTAEIPAALRHIRILWVAFSALVVLFYLARKNRQKDGLIH
jgi:hypothetical protein